MLTAADALPHRPRRVAVAGVSGTGKTTLAARIAAVTDGAHTEIDALYHGPDWVPRPEFLDDVLDFTSAESWTTEWQYNAARPRLGERADLIVWLDLPFARVTLPRVVRRTIRRRARREQLWNGNVERPLWTILTDPEHIIRWAIATRGVYRQRIPELERLHPHLVIVRLRSQREADAWVATTLPAAVRGGHGSPMDQRLHDHGPAASEPR
ncbi:Adenylate kinase [Microterricola viridarii]|uniref:Adenylate kinase n=2 Tax=Microterricola viridarii TaxID=412690 RepID=A0A1H1WGR9_9MICO|nr:AAA family ATPase [Microterricola viridarii]SDS96232.1 Adenylate kinase [Microterricola viridarii]